MISHVNSKVENVLLTYLINSTLINNDIFNIVTVGTIYLICSVRPYEQCFKGNYLTLNLLVFV